LGLKMNAKELVAQLRARNITLTPIGDRLYFHPPESVSEPLLERIRQSKPRVMEVLHAEITEACQNRLDEVIDRVNSACPEHCQLSAEDWRQLDQTKLEFLEARKNYDLNAFTEALSRYEQLANSIFRDRDERKSTQEGSS